MPQKIEISRQRNQTITLCRIRAGLLTMFHRPWKIAIFALLSALFYMAWTIRNQPPLPPEVKAAPILANIYGFVVPFLIILLFTVIFTGILIAFGTPRSAVKIERSLVHIGLTDRYDCGPLLIERKHIKGTDIQVLTFLSLGIAKETWEKNLSSIEDALNMTCIEKPTYGGKHQNHRNYIVLTVAPGIRTHQKEALYDDEL